MLDQLNKLRIQMNHFSKTATAGGGNSNIFVIFTPNIGEDEPILASIFFKGVETTD